MTILLFLAVPIIRESMVGHKVVGMYQIVISQSDYSTFYSSDLIRLSAGGKLTFVRI